MKSIFEEMGGTYTLGADGMYYPSCLDIAVAMIHGNDFDVVHFSHLLCTSLCLFVFIKNAPFQ